MNWLRNKIIMVFIFCLCLIPVSESTGQPLEQNAKNIKIQNMPSNALTNADHTILRQRVTITKNSADALEYRLDAMLKKSSADRIESWKEVHEAITMLKTDSLKITERMSALKNKNLRKSDWVALNQSTGNDLRAIQLKLENIRKKYEALSTINSGQMRENIKAKRSEIESKFKAGEQARNSDYNILISIIKTINEELGIFNKAMM